MSLFRLMWVFFRIGAMNEMQYRVNFLIQLLQSLIALGTGLIALALVFSHTTDLGGWSRPELLAVMGVHILMGGLIMSV
ncbi:MAG: ABC-2 family transporter protein, partial [Chloroflexales bacterium]|nr:ABC-2 family transporter protein [Chloroflexales bacterium]